MYRLLTLMHCNTEFTVFVKSLWATPCSHHICHSAECCGFHGTPNTPDLDNQHVFYNSQSVETFGIPQELFQPFHMLCTQLCTLRTCSFSSQLVAVAANLVDLAKFSTPCLATVEFNAPYASADTINVRNIQHRSIWLDITR